MTQLTTLRPRRNYSHGAQQYCLHLACGRQVGMLHAPCNDTAVQAFSKFTPAHGSVVLDAAQQPVHVFGKGTHV